MYNINRSIVVITPKKPFARPNTIMKAIDMTRKAGISVLVNTNLLLLTPEIAIKMKELDLNSVLVSCPASDPNV